jgi:hypothetical protein
MPEHWDIKACREYGKNAPYIPDKTKEDTEK